MKLRPGTKNRRITIQERSSAVDVDGWRDGHSGAATVWTTVATCWASVRPIGGREFHEANAARQAEVSWRVRFDYLELPTMTAKHRILVTTDAETSPATQRILNVDSLIPAEGWRGYWEALCMEGPTRG